MFSHIGKFGVERYVENLNHGATETGSNTEIYKKKSLPGNGKADSIHMRKCSIVYLRDKDISILIISC